MISTKLNSESFKIDENLAEFYGILIGDGCISKFKNQGRTHHAIRIDGNSLTDIQYYNNHLKKLVEGIIHREVKIKFRKVGNCIFIMFEYKNFAVFLNNYLKFPFGKKGNISINEEFIKNQQFLIAILRGLFDTDGCLYFTKNNSKDRSYPIIEISTHSSALVNQLYQVFCKFGFKVKISHFKDSVKLHGKDNLIKFMKFVGTNHPDKLSKFNYWRKFGYCPKIDELNFESRMKKLNSGP
ncbi:MAG TPA: LAGLIDADG family homing endonuclease [Candidatus Nanoarchaeia archaeon]|nr:LAGLIDADG family homing endonuclease [Candidatus Nanoarchaeia archaeon]